MFQGLIFEPLIIRRTQVPCSRFLEQLTRGELEERLAMMLGGRSAELLVFGKPTIGAANDLERATELARRMVTEFGMTEALGPVRYLDEAGMGYLGGRSLMRAELSPETTRQIDQEMRRLIEAAQERAMSLLREHRAVLDEIARVLIEKEVIDGQEIARIVNKGAA